MNLARGFSPGTGAGSQRAFLWQNGHLRNLGVLPGDTDSSVIAMNDRGQIVGASWVYSESGPGHPDPGHAFLWEHGQMRDLGVLRRSDASKAVDINQSGEIAGSSTYESSSPDRAVAWEQGAIRNLGALRLGDTSDSVAINDAGQIVGDSGSRTFLWQDGKMRDLGSPPGYGEPSVDDINDSGQVVGVASSRRGDNPFIWEQGAFTVIPLGDIWEPLAVNDHGQVVLNEGADAWAFWQDGKVLHRGSGDALALNERGQVAFESYGEQPRVWGSGRIEKLPLLPGDDAGAAVALNERDQVVGLSGTMTADYSGAMTDYTWHCRVVLWTRQTG